MKEDETVAIAVLENDTETDQTSGINADPDAEVLSASISETDLLGPEHGTISILNGVITYDSNQDFNGTDTFQYYCCDGESKTAATVNVTVSQVNDDPVAVSDEATTDEDTAVTKNVVENDTDVDTLPGLNKTPDSLSDFSVDELLMTGSENGTFPTPAGRSYPRMRISPAHMRLSINERRTRGASSSTMTVQVASRTTRRLPWTTR